MRGAESQRPQFAIHKTLVKHRTSQPETKLWPRLSHRSRPYVWLQATRCTTSQIRWPKRRPRGIARPGPTLTSTIVLTDDAQR